MQPIPAYEVHKWYRHLLVPVAESIGVRTRKHCVSSWLGSVRLISLPEAVDEVLDAALQAIGVQPAVERIKQQAIDVGYDDIY